MQFDTVEHLQRLAEGEGKELDKIREKLDTAEQLT